MDNRETELSLEKAQTLMSLLLDGELATEQAEQLNQYLEKHPEQFDWMEAQSKLRESAFPQAKQNPNHDDAINAIIDQLPKQPQPSNSKLLQFPLLFKSIAAAAAVAVIGITAWNFNSTPIEMIPSSGAEIEFVSSDIPNANPIVYTDEESGWTVVWVEAMEPIPEEA